MKKELQVGEIIQKDEDSNVFFIFSFVSAKASLECANSIIEDLDEEDPENAQELILANRKGKNEDSQSAKTIT